MSFTSVDLPDPLTPVIAGQQAQRDPHVEVLEVVRPRAANHELASQRRAPHRGHVDHPLAPEVLAGERGAIDVQQLVRRALEDHAAAVLAGAGAEVDHVVRRADRLLVVLDDDDRVAEVAQPAQRRQQPPVVALVQADGRLVEHVEHAAQVRADLRRQADALRLAAGQRGGAAAERQVADADVDEEPQPLDDLAVDPAGHQRLPVRQHVLLEGPQRVRDGQRHAAAESCGPSTCTARLSGRRRSPWQPSHGRRDRYGSMSAWSTHVACSYRRRRFGMTPSKPLPYGSFNARRPSSGPTACARACGRGPVAGVAVAAVPLDLAAAEGP